MTEPTIFCPRCQAEIKLTESLAASLVEATRLAYQRRIKENVQQCAKREEAVREQEQGLNNAKQEWQAAEQARLRKDRERIALEEGQRAATRFSQELNQKAEAIVSRGDISRSLMGFGFECEDGWFPLIYALFEEIEPLAAGLDSAEIVQVKQKFGGLRVATRGPTMPYTMQL
jgi:hypothetical protein